jgi:TonB family protein
MTMRRARRLLIAAFALSLIVHLFLAGVITWPFAAPRYEPQVVSIEKRPRVLRIAHSTRPQRPRTTHAVHQVRTPQIAKTGHAPSTTTASTSAPTPAPTPAGNRCVKASAAAAIAASPPPPDISSEVRAGARGGIAQVRVRLDPAGAVTGADVVQSTGDNGLDAVALSLARAATYTPAYAGCKPIPGGYTFRVEFVAW